LYTFGGSKLLKFLPNAEITPSDTLGLLSLIKKPYGLPTAIAHSPIIKSDDVPNLAKGKPSPSILKIAISCSVSMPTNAASNSALLLMTTVI
jgi:hypothetical protein